MVTEHLAVVGRKNDKRLIVLTGLFEVRNQTPDLMIHLGNQSKINRSHRLAVLFRHGMHIHLTLEVGRIVLLCQPCLDERMRGGSCLPRLTSCRARYSTHIDHLVIGRRCDHRRVRPKEHRVHKPVLVTAQLPVIEHAVGNERTVAVLGSILRRRPREPLHLRRRAGMRVNIEMLLWHLIPALCQLGQPLLKARLVQHGTDLKSRQKSFIRSEPRITRRHRPRIR